MQNGSPSAFVIPVRDNWVSALFAANRLIRGGHRLLWVTQVRSANGLAPAVAAGDVIVPLDPTYDPGLPAPLDPEQIGQVLADANVEAIPLAATTGIVAAPIGLVRVGMYGGGGAPMNHASIMAACGFPIRFLSDAEVRAGELSDVDVFIVPGGGARAMHGQIEPLGKEGCRAVARFVRDGGMYIGCCAGSYDCIINADSFLASCPAQEHLQLLNAVPWQGDSGVKMFDIQSPGVGVVQARNDRPDHPVMFGMPPTFPLVHYNGPILDPLAESRIPGASGAQGLASFNGVTDQFTPAERFAGPIATDQSTYIAQGIAAERFSGVTGEFGTGRVVAFGSHPELGADLPMVEWFDAARMLANAVLWQAVSRPGREPENGFRPTAGPLSLPVGSGYTEVIRLAQDLGGRARALQQQSVDPAPAWLAPEYAMSVFGLSAPEIWRRALANIIELSDRLASHSGALSARVTELMQSSTHPAPAILRQAILVAERRLLYNRHATWNQDGGYQGVLSLLETAIDMCERALAGWNVELGPPAGPYAYLDTNPYHLVAGSYLAAIGVVGGAVQLLRVTESELAMAEQLSRDLGTEPSVPLLATAGAAR